MGRGCYFYSGMSIMLRKLEVILYCEVTFHSFPGVRVFFKTLIRWKEEFSHLQENLLSVCGTICGTHFCNLQTITSNCQVQKQGQGVGRIFF